MKEEIKYNLYNYLTTNSKIAKVVSVLIVIICILLFFVSYEMEVDTIEEFNATTICEEEICVLQFYKQSLEQNTISFVQIGKNNYNIQNVSYSAPEIDTNNVVYQKVSLELEDYSGNPNEIVKIQVYKNKEKIYKKIIKIILER